MPVEQEPRDERASVCRGASSSPPLVLAVGEGVEVLGSAGTKHLERHERTGAWTLMACLDLWGERLAVFEEHGSDDDPDQRSRHYVGRPGQDRDENRRIVYVGTSGVRLELAKSMVPTRVDEARCYGGYTKAAIRGARRDILREQMLAGEGDPEPEQVSELFPPIRRARAGAYELPHTFVGSPDCHDVVPIYYNPVRARPRIQPLAVSLELDEAIEREFLLEGLVGSWLPAVCIGYPVERGTRWESLIFAKPEAPSVQLQPVWYRYVKVEHGEVREAHYFDSEIPYPWPEEPPPEVFYRDLAGLHRYWHGRLSGGMQLELPEKWIVDFCRHSMAREMITRFGDHPRYGVVDRAYGGSEHDGLQDVLTSAVTCYLEWGHLDVARRYLDQYLSCFVRSDGSLRYRGPEIGQYGRMLTVLARFHELTQDDSLLLAHHDKIVAIAELLLSRRKEAVLRRVDDPAFGLIVGRHEADISFDTPTLRSQDYERPYFSNSTEAWRGLRDIGRAWRAMGSRRNDEELTARGARLLEEAEVLADDVRRAVDRSWIERDGVRTLPLFAGARALHLDAPYRSCPESFDENRVWSEMLYSGILDRQSVETILDAAAAHGDSTLGIFGNRNLVVAFTACGEAYGMIQHDLVREFLLLYYAHAFHMHTRGTWTAFECVDMDRDRAEHLPYCAPAQLTIPILTKWMLVFEDSLAFEVWLAKAVPRRWLADGCRVRVTESQTRWGPITYEIRSRIDSDLIEATVDLPRRREGPVILRLRVPNGRLIRSVDLDGQSWEHFNRAAEYVVLPQELSGSVRVIAHY